MIVSESRLVSGRPRPKPRLSLLLTPGDFSNHDYENFKNESLYYNEKFSFATEPDQQLVPKPKPRRRSLIDFPVTEFSVIKSDNLSKAYSKTTKFKQDSGGGPVPVLSAIQNSEAIQTSLEKPSVTGNEDLLHQNGNNHMHDGVKKCNKNCIKNTENSSVSLIREVTRTKQQPTENTDISALLNDPDFDKFFSSNISDNFCEEADQILEHKSAFRPLKCMPYNSPQLPKGPRGQGVPNEKGAAGLSKPLSGRSQTSKMPRSTTKSGSADSIAKGKHITANDAKTSKISGNTIPSRSERGAVSTMKQLRRPSFKKLEEACARDSDSSDSSSIASSSSVSSVSNRTRKKSGSGKPSTMENRRSTAVPPQMVANLTSKFNALISQNQTSESVNRKPVRSLSSSTDFIKSCPSSPLHNTPKMTVSQPSKKEVEVEDTKPVKSFVRGSVLHSSFPERKRDAVVAKKSSTLPADLRSSDSDSSLISGKKDAASYVKRAVLHYEVNISASSSPELERKNSFSARRVSDSSLSSNSPLLMKRILQNNFTIPTEKPANTSTTKDNDQFSRDASDASCMNKSRAPRTLRISNETASVTGRKKEEKTKRILSQESSVSDNESTMQVENRLKIFHNQKPLETTSSTFRPACITTGSTTTMTTSRILNVRRNIQPAAFTSSFTDSFCSESDLSTDSDAVPESNLKSEAQARILATSVNEEGKIKTFSSQMNCNEMKNVSSDNHHLQLEQNGSNCSENSQPMSPICRARMILERRNKTVGSISNSVLEQAKNYSESKAKDTKPPPLPTTNPRIIPKFRSMRINPAQINTEMNDNSTASNLSSRLHSKSLEDCKTSQELSQTRQLIMPSENVDSNLIANTKVTDNNEIIAIHIKTNEKKSIKEYESQRSFKSKSNEIQPTEVQVPFALNKTQESETIAGMKQTKTVKSWSIDKHMQFSQNKDDMFVKKLEINKSNYVPNTSFLWRETKLHQVNLVFNAAIPPPPMTAPPPIPKENEKGNFEKFSGSQEPMIYDDVISPSFDDDYEEPLYSEAVVTSSVDLLSSGKLSLNNKQNSIEKTDFDTHNDSDEGWEDVSDTEIESGSFKHSSLPAQLKPRSLMRKSGCKRALRRSWSQSLRELTSMQENGRLDEKEKENNEKENLTHDESFDSDDSDSTDPNHHYETLYEVIAQGRQSISSDECKESYSSLQQEMPSAENSNAERIVEDPSEDDIEQKQNPEEGETRKQLKRNWSLTKSDIRLELTSRLNRIRVKKTSTSTTNVHMNSVETQMGDNKKKPWSLKTKFTRKKSTTSTSPKQSPSPKKESALFYVQNFVAEPNSENEIGEKVYVPSESVIQEHEVSNCELARVSQKSLSSLDEDEYSSKTESVYSISSQPSLISNKSRASSRSKIVRPKTPPPAPPSQPGRSKDLPNSCKELAKQTEDVVDNCLKNPGIDKNQKYFANGTGPMKYCNGIDEEPTRFNHQNAINDVHLQSSILASRSSIASSTSTSSSDTYLPMRHATRQISDTSLDPTLQLRHHESSEKPQSHCENNDLESSTFNCFEDEPLYQFYNMDAQKRATQLNMIDDMDSDEYNEYEIYEPLIIKQPNLQTKTTAMDLIIPTESGQRTLWGEVKEVRSSGILDTISPVKRNLQEAMFEVITSEASYLKSLTVLTNHFMKCPQFVNEYSPDCVLTKRQFQLLFSGVTSVKQISEKLLADLEKRWQESVVLTDICDIIYDHASKNFDVYKKYCANQVYQDRALKDLRESNPAFVENLKQLESNSICQNLSMHSFLMLPMQRVTRLPLLVDAIFKRLDPDTAEYHQCKLALNTLNAIVKECNEAACRMQRMEEMMVISRLLDFRDIKSIPLISPTRWLVKKGELFRLVCTEGSKLPFRRCVKKSIYVYLFTDLMVVTKKKGDQLYHVCDYCPRNMIQVTDVINPELLTVRPHDGFKNLFQLTMLKNHENRTVEMVLYSATESDVTRWMAAISPPTSENPDEVIYEQWDCPQVQAIHAYPAQQPDELSLEESDVVNVFKKVADGWYHGERIRDGTQGWFPGNYTTEILNAHVRARNLRQRYRFLLCLEEQRRKDEQQK